MCHPMISTCYYLVISALFCIIGMIVYGVEVNSNLPVYPTTLLVSGSVLGILGGTFVILQVANV